ncbi:hypothetical protein [Algivirga pacifica]|uniref:Uncharacterized protein n=1 Tax=Algivirga pacifica TaxID=1162670 RepID=A0ABP9D689_9BACT
MLGFVFIEENHSTLLPSFVIYDTVIDGAVNLFGQILGLKGKSKISETIIMNIVGDVGEIGKAALSDK